MLKYIEKRFALSRNGAIDLVKGTIYSTLLNFALMTPAVLAMIFINDYINRYNAIEGIKIGSTTLPLYYNLNFNQYLLLILIFIGIIYVISIYQYDAVYTNVYNGSAERRITIAEKLRKLPLSFFAEKNLSDLTTTILDDCSTLENIFSHAVPQLFASIITITIMGVGIFFFNWQLAIALLWVVPVSFGLILFSKKKMYRSFENTKEVKLKLTDNIVEALENIQDLKAYMITPKYMRKIEDAANNYEKYQINSEIKTVGVLLNGAYSILKLGMASVIILGAIKLLNGDIDIFTYIAFVIISAIIYAPINEVINNISILLFLDVSINRLNDINNLSTMHGSTDFTPKDYNIEFKNVSFSYENRQGNQNRKGNKNRKGNQNRKGNKNLQGNQKEVITNLSFTAKQGEVTALVGESGCGKSTAAKLAARFWDVDSGEILLGGVNIKTIDPETLLKYYAVVFQDVVLFNTSVYDNIRIGKKDATNEEIIKIAKLTHCHEFIEKLPNGYDTILGENGNTLSGGERQRISIARALLKDAPIILLDEATASLDVENEGKIQESLSRLIKDKTVLVIAHRIRTIANADKIITLH